MKKKEAVEYKVRKRSTIKQKIVSYVMAVSILLGILITGIMSVSSVISTNVTLLDIIQLMAKTSSQNVSANLHLLTDRMSALALEKELSDETIDTQVKQQILDERESRIEFVWLAAYDLSGKKLYGDDTAPDSIEKEKYYTYLTKTNNVVVGEPSFEQEIWQLSVGIPVQKDGKASMYLIGSYKYDLLNDVLSNITLGSTGSAYIINGDGLVVADQNMDNMAEKINIYDKYGSKENNPIFDNMRNSQTGSTSMDLLGEVHYVAYSPVPGTNWTLIIDAPRMEFLGTLSSAVVLCVVLSVVLLVIALFVIWRLAKKISSSLSLATGRLTSLSEGNLKEEVVLADTHDEAEILTYALQKTIISIDSYLSDMKKSLDYLSKGDYSKEIPDTFIGDFREIRDALISISQSLNETMRQMNRSSFAVSQNSSQVSGYAKMLYTGSKDQTEALENLNASIQLIGEKIDVIDESAKQVEVCADGAGSKVRQGNGQMEIMLTMMNDIYANMQEIIKISRLIEDISSQTRLLSFNASIEAAHAGETGRGFAVVANEIGTLSEKTAEALSQTMDIIKQATQSIDKGLETAKLTASSFSEIDSAAKEFSDISSNMAIVANAQKTAIDSVRQEVNKVLEIANTNKELAKETDETAALSLTQAEELKNFVASVKLREDR